MKFIFTEKSGKYQLGLDLENGSKLEFFNTAWLKAAGFNGYSADFILNLCNYKTELYNGYFYYISDFYDHKLLDKLNAFLIMNELCK